MAMHTLETRSYHPLENLASLTGRPVTLLQPCMMLLTFIGGSMLIRDRRAHEKDLLQSYLSALKHTGGPKRGIEDVWEEYRR